MCWAVLAAGVIVLLGCAGGESGGDVEQTGMQVTGGQSTGSGQPESTGTGPKNCVLADLSITTEEGPVGSTDRSVIAIYTNISGLTCRVPGYPEVVALDATGASVAAADHTRNGYLGGIPDPAGIAQVDVAPGGQASAMIESRSIVVSDGSSCTPYARPPSSRSWTYRRDLISNHVDKSKIAGEGSGERGAGRGSVSLRDIGSPP